MGMQLSFMLFIGGCGVAMMFVFLKHCFIQSVPMGYGY